ncbi:MAG TPA: AAA family ATPase [Acidobacteriaceae bacterium]|nr:AAA family ATPase [Acidobacteriaceae bacterium]
MRRFILTGAPGSGKTAILRQLEIDGCSVVEEAATDIIAAAQAQGTAEPWTRSSFIDAVVHLQKERCRRASHHPDDVQFHDRSAVCTAALATYLGYPWSSALSAELDRIRDEGLFEKRVFLVRTPGFITPTGARRISYEETLRFEAIHEQTYRELGFELVPIEPAPLMGRVGVIRAAIR